nr:hypothetical protein GCM10020093_005690 [Planobispora longispora]
MKYHIAMATPPNSSSMPLPTATPRIPNSRGGIIGWAAKRVSTTVKAASRSRPAATGPATCADVQP